ncbi:MAG: lipid-A-disaccharide synthase [Candidatus Zixiibacteriota bacterium]
MKKKILIIAGEASGDLHSSGLIKELRKLNQEMEIFGIGGNKMKETGVELIYDMERFSLIGFSEVLKRLNFFRKMMNSMVSCAEDRSPDLVILVDYPGFNLRLAQRLKKKGIPILYYISPQIWAWGGKRLEKIKNLVNKILVFFPFEEKIYNDAGVDVEFIGHPLLELVKPTLSQEEYRRRMNLGKNDILLGLLPGSRTQEVEKILPVMLQTCLLLKKRLKKLKVGVSLASIIEKDLLKKILNQFELEIILEKELTYDLMHYSDLLLVTSGTATLESAIAQTPLLILYKTSFLNWILAKSMIRIPYIGLVNVVAGKKIVPEFIQYQAKPELLAGEAFDILSDRKKYEDIKAELNKVKQRLGQKGAYKKAAGIVNQMLVN